MTLRSAGCGPASRRLNFAFVALAALFFALALGQGQSVRPLPFDASSPSFLPVHNVLFPEPSSFWGQVSAPFPTNIWWSNLAFEYFPLFTYPYIQTPSNASLSVCVPTLSANNVSFTSACANVFNFSSIALNTRRIVSWDRLGVVSRWSSSTDPNALLEAPFVQGSPFATFFMRLDSLNLTTSEGFFIRALNGAVPTPGMTYSGRSFRMTVSPQPTDNPPPQPIPDQTWVLYSLNDDISITYYTERISSERSSYDRFLIVTSGAVLSTFRFAIIPNDDFTTILDTFVPNIVLGGDVAVNYSTEPIPTTSTVTFLYRAVDGLNQSYDGNQVLMFALPHHLPVLQNAKLLATPLTCSRGPLTGVIGNTWYLQHSLTSIQWGAPRPYDTRKMTTLMTALKNDVSRLTSKDNDTYSTGKLAGALARLVLIADEMNQTAYRDTALSRLDALLTPWMNRVTYRDTFLYDLTYSGAISANGWTDRNQDFGNVIYNDHHYHNGYFIYAGAVLLKYKSAWPYRSQIVDLARDIANPSFSDSYYPIARHKDWYLGHSWAQGIDATYDGKNQESTSEAVNAYYAVYLLGLSLGNSEMRDFARTLLATEIHSVKSYYHMFVNGSIYPNEFAVNAAVGILWSDKADYATFFGQQTEFIHCIQMLPFTPITEELLEADWIAVDFDVLKSALIPGRLPKLQDQWRAYIIMSQAVIDRDSAWTKSLFLTEDAFKWGNSRTNVAYWIATRPNATLPLK